MDRRHLLGLAAGAGAGALLITGPTSSASQSTPAAELPDISGQEVVVVGYGGQSLEVQQAEIYPIFEEETGATVIGTGGMDPRKMEQMVLQNTVEWDVVLLGPEESPLTSEWLEPLDYSIIQPIGIPEEGIHEYGIASDFYSVVLVWDTETYGDNPPQSWADFWNPDAFPGRRTLPRRSYDIVELALMGDGVDPANMYPVDLERALAAIERIEPHVAKFWTGGNEPVELLLSGEVDMAAVWVTRIIEPIESGAPLDFTWNQHLLAQDIVAIPKGAPNKDAAMQFINFRIRPDIQAAIANLLPIGPSTTEADELIDPDRQRFLPTSEENLPLGHFRDPAYWIQHHAEIDAEIRNLLGA
jgi:putative spermidine/putrescine transport system substrate-binding protein